MTVTAVEAPRSGAGRRVADVVRIQMVSWVTLVLLPLGILAMVLAVNLAIFVFAVDSDPAKSYGTGGMAAIFFVVGTSHLQSITQLFPFALGISVTRRAFFAGTTLVVAAQAATFGLVLLLLSYVEVATGGWGLRVQFFRFGFLEESNPLAQWLVYAVPFLVVSASFVFIGVVFKRWGQAGMYAMSVIAAVLVAGAAVLVTWLRLWPAVESFFANASPLALFAGYPLVIAAVLGAAAYALLRRATP